MISHSFLLFLGLCQAVILPSKDLQMFVSGFNVPNDLRKMKMVDKYWIDVEQIYTNLNPKVIYCTFLHKETNKIYDAFGRDIVFEKLIGVKMSYNAKQQKWTAQRWSKQSKKVVYNGSYNCAETAAHASDTLARHLMRRNGERHELNYPDDHTEVYSQEKKTASCFIGVTWNNSKWLAQRRSKIEKKTVYNGSYGDQETAAHASDTLARKLVANGEQKLKLNFPDDHTEVYPEKPKNKRKRQDDSQNK